tara:strand:- start:272 stop:622 length:351 start_codon:yes stop_codon:yes gene_type:complete
MKATGESVIVRPFKMEEKTSGGIIVSDKNKRHSSNFSIGQITQIGPLAFERERWLERDFNISNPLVAKVDDYVLCAKHSGYDIKISGEVIRVCLPADVLAILTEEEALSLTTWTGV